MAGNENSGDQTPGSEVGQGPSEDGRASASGAPAAGGGDEPKFGDLATFTKAGLRITDESLLKRLNRKSLSASTAKSMQGCTARWVGERVLQRPDIFAANSLGTAAHTVFERLFMRPASSRTYRDALGLVLILTEETFSTPDPLALGLPAGTSDDMMRAIRADWANEVIDRVRGLWDIEDPGDVVTRRTEFRIEPGQVELGGVPFVGIIDRIDEVTVDDKPRSKVKDYKAGKSDVPDANKIKRYGDDHGDQMRLYYAALAELEGQAPAGADLYYTFHGKKKRVAVAKNRVNATIRDFKQSWEILQSSVEAETFSVQPGPLCGWCPLVKACPAALASGKTARVAAPEPVDLGLHVPVLALAPETDGGVVHQPLTLVPDPTPAATPAPASGAEPADAPAAFETVGDPFTEERARFVSPAVEEAGTGADDQAEAATTDHLTALTAPAEPDNDLTDLEGDDLMSALRYAAREPKPWEGAPSDGSVNGNAYSTMAAFGLLELATDLLSERDLPLSRKQILALTHTLAGIVGDAQRRLAGAEDLNAGLHSRLRGALRTVLTTMAPPLPASPAAPWPTVAEWQDWVAAATRRTVAYAEMAHEVLTTPRPPQPYLDLVEPGSVEASVTPLRPAQEAAPSAAQPQAQPAQEPQAPAAASQPVNHTVSQPISQPVPAPSEVSYSPADDFPL